MAGCGYICPICEGRNYLDDGSLCSYCNRKDNTKNEDGPSKEEDEIIDDNFPI